MRALATTLVPLATAILLAGCGGDDSSTLESLTGTPASVHIVKDVETMAHACNKPSKQARRAALAAYAGLAEVAAIHPKATFGPDGTDVTMRQLLRRTVEKTGHCFGLSVDSKGRYRADLP